MLERVFASTIFHSRASTNLWPADYMAINQLKSATTNVNSAPQLRNGQKSKHLKGQLGLELAVQLFFIWAYAVAVYAY